MGTITFVEYDGTTHEIELVDGSSLMQLATSNGVPGIDGDCGGEASCGTCHVIVDEAWAARTGTRSEEESQMIEMSPECAPNSRLACQITATPDLDGLTVRLPEFQM
ncbi:2Fe-2S iron-sulfur cluster binding domain-containing protein [Conexibacter sp. W3-3-2]|uniref:2Fe-2S ferredoxin n=1 Tax=Paraconexibacter algicola TaxID=2133960 RepID=A0A2T4UCP9_9ACTN|nr:MULTISPECIES: 2Fe-2S iron-sulfur cluster-binding protein [Solirubrobacterales]MTD43237.1 2Fe-2S iron-sulfur cluster binding domain-containing protein [Conexibacter sp. W3-3-2]PTL54982.1 2Fe-2S ferredoxin [Paraconexibacter algicola]